MDLTYMHLANNADYNQVNVGTAYANATAATDVSPGGNVLGQAYTFAADQLRIGQAFRVTARGIASTSGTPNLTLGLYYGGVAGTALATTGALATSSGLSNTLWKFEMDLQVQAVGTAGAIYALGNVTGPWSGTIAMPATSSSGNLVGSLDTSTSKILTLGAAWGTPSASNSLQVIMFRVERLNEGGS